MKVAERHLVLSSTDLGDAKSITDVILAELTKVVHARSMIHCTVVVIYNFFRRPSAGIHYDGENLKRLLEQR